MANPIAGGNPHRAWSPKEDLRPLFDSVEKELGLTVSWRERLVRRIVPRSLQLRLAFRDLERDDPRWRDRGLRSLYILQDVRAVKPLLALLQGEPRRWHNRVADIVARLGDVAIDEIDRSVETFPPETQRRLLASMGYSRSTKAAGVLGRFLDSPEPATRLAAAKSLERLDTPDSRAVLTVAARHGDAEVAEIARASFYRTQPMDVLFADLSVDDWDVREEIADALAERDPREVGPMLRRVLQDEEQQRRLGAACALGRLRYREAATDLLALAAADAEDLDVREMAIEALAQIGDRSVVPGLRALADEADLGDAVAAALRKIGSADAETLIADLRSPKASVRRRAVNALAAAGDVRAVPPLLDLMRSEHRADDKRVIASAILRILKASDDGAPTDQRGRSTDREAIASELVQQLHDPDALVRWSLVGALHAIWCPSAMEAAVRMAADDDPSVRLQAVNAFSAAGADVRALGILGEFLGHPDVDVRRAATRVIGGIDLVQAVSLLAAALRDGHEGVREEAAAAFGKSPWAPDVGDQVVAALLSALDDPSGRVRTAVLLAAKNLTYRYRLRADVRDAFVRRAARDLRDEDILLAIESIDALGRLGGDEAIRTLAGALEDDRPPVRQRAALALSDGRSPSARELLANRLAPEDDSLTLRQIEMSIAHIDDLQEQRRRG